MSLPVKPITWSIRPIGDTKEQDGFGALGEVYFLSLQVNNYSPKTITNKRETLHRFVSWCAKREVIKPHEVTEETLYSYKKHLHFYQTAQHKPLSIYSQRLRLTIVKVFFEWLFKNQHVNQLVAKEIELPKLPYQLPRNILSEKDVERLVNTPDLTTPTGLRNRAMIEVLYSTGIRRAELLDLHLYDVDFERGLLFIRQGKGRRDRLIPIGQRALGWINKYLGSARENMVKDGMNEHLFVTYFGDPIRPSTFTRIMRELIKATGLTKQGSVHIMRHTTATLMLDHGADIRHIQQLLGHSSLTNTQIYTQVSVKQLKEVHDKTHPANISHSIEGNTPLE